ncbi:hypothetical protein CDAR_163711 [Caerostris darwini]|uniref:Uncharacterized protein n=1 Tax=Caerostris darwini TaxID=1538125 RepID=A0AAV4RRV9_9ARAC|nr:hypothetical protein CDAR_163711 [Caerostris darwini]
MYQLLPKTAFAIIKHLVHVPTPTTKPQNEKAFILPLSLFDSLLSSALVAPTTKRLLVECTWHPHFLMKRGDSGHERKHPSMAPSTICF